MNKEKLEKLRTQVKTLDSISTAPVILKPLLEILRMPVEKIKLEKVVELVSYDSAIAAQCLRLANSALYARREVESVRAAVMALGLHRVRSMLFGLCMNRVMPRDRWVCDPVMYWRHSLGCALISERMAHTIDYPEADKVYLAGLLHDLGLLVNSMLCTDEFRKSWQNAAETHRALHLCEQEIIGFTHSDSGKMLAEHWHLPQELCEVVSAHHQPESLAAPNPLACIVHVGDLLCRVRGLGYGYEEVLGVELGSSKAWEILAKSHPGLAEMDMARFTLDIDGAMDQIVATVDAVFGAGSGAKAQTAQ